MTSTAIAGVITQDDILDAIYRIEADDESPNGVVWNPRTGNQVRKQKDAEGEYKALHPTIADLNLQPTTAVPINLTVGANDDTSEIYVGDFTQVIQGVRTTLNLEATRVGSDTTNSAFGSLQVWIRAYLRMDFALQHDEAFEVLTDVRG